MMSVLDYGAIGDGKADDAPSIQKALDSGKKEINIPAGIYRIEKTLLVGSNTTLYLADDAIIRLADGAGQRAGAGGFLITNRDHISGNREIRVEGGIWDGNNPCNPRGPDGPPNSYTGVAINFVNVRGLNLSGLTVTDPDSFFIRIGETRDFLVEDITLKAPHVRPNQDGIHIGGFCEDGVIRHIKGTGDSCPNDDMVAINANDDVTRAINLSMKEGPIRRIQIEDITAEDAYTFVRILSQDAPVEDIHIDGIRGGCRYHVLNLNRWRFPLGKGKIKRVCIENVEVIRRPNSTYSAALIDITLNVQDIEIKDFRRPEDGHPEVPSLNIKNGVVSDITLDGLSESQCRALECASTAEISCKETKDTTGGCSINAVVKPQGNLCMPLGGFRRLHVRSR